MSRDEEFPDPEKLSRSHSAVYRRFKAPLARTRKYPPKIRELKIAPFWRIVVRVEGAFSMRFRDLFVNCRGFTRRDHFTVVTIIKIINSILNSIPDGILASPCRSRGSSRRSTRKGTERDPLPTRRRSSEARKKARL